MRTHVTLLRDPVENLYILIEEESRTILIDLSKHCYKIVKSRIEAYDYIKKRIMEELEKNLEEYLEKMELIEET